MEEITKIAWWEPFRHARAHGWTLLQHSGLLRPIFWARVIGLCAAVIGLLIVILLLIHPGTWVPWRRLFVILLFAPAFFLLQFGLIVLIPRNIEVRRDGVHIINGQQTISIQIKDIQSIELVDPKGTESRLKIDYINPRGRQRKFDFAVSAKVDRHALERLVSHLSHEAKKHPKV